ncbi:MAG: DUF3489 domain-containing protein [Pseudomonadota bacterium]
MAHVEDVTTSNVSASLEAVSAKLAADAPRASATSGEEPERTAGTKKSNKKPDGKKAATTKAATVEKLLQRKTGASIDQIAKATGWQAHTCRAFLTGVRKKGREVVRETGRDDRSVYRIAAAAPGAKAG